jgi:hypothetical protein
VEAEEVKEGEMEGGQNNHYQQLKEEDNKEDG